MYTHDVSFVPFKAPGPFKKNIAQRLIMIYFLVPGPSMPNDAQRPNDRCPWWWGFLIHDMDFMGPGTWRMHYLLWSHIHGSIGVSRKSMVFPHKVFLAFQRNWTHFFHHFCYTKNNILGSTVFYVWHPMTSCFGVAKEGHQDLALIASTFLFSPSCAHTMSEII